MTQITKEILSKSLKLRFHCLHTMCYLLLTPSKQNIMKFVQFFFSSEPKDVRIEDLHWEALRLQFEFEELMALKSELERRKRSERNEMEDLREEIATMQTLYQYRLVQRCIGIQ